MLIDQVLPVSNNDLLNQGLEKLTIKEYGGNKMKFEKLCFKVGIVALSTMLLAACGDSEEPNVDEAEGGGGGNIVEELTDEDITLTFSAWFEYEWMEHMAQKFTELYPNIKVDIIDLRETDYNDGLNNLAADGQLPDVFGYNSNVDMPIMNGWFYDYTDYWEADPDKDIMLETLKDQGRFDGERMMASPINYYPYAVFIDENLLEKENVEMPPGDYTYNDLVELVRRMTVPEKNLFGYEGGSQWLTMAPIIHQDSIGEFGWDGTEYDLTKDWADALQLMAEFERTGVKAPAGDDRAEAAYGDRELWPPLSGQVAVKLGAWWDKDSFETAEYKDKGINYVPYTIPKGDGDKEHKPAYVDFGGISSATEYPREAFELLKFMSWGSEGWDARMEFYNQEAEANPNYLPPILPLTNEQKYWDAIYALLPQNQYYSDFLQHAREPIPLGGRVLPGFETWISEVYFDGEFGNVEQAVIEGTVNAHDVAPELTEKANVYYQEAIEELFSQ